MNWRRIYMNYRMERCNAEGFGRPEPFYFPCKGRTYSPPAKQAVVSLLRRVVRSPRGMRLLREPPDNATSPAGAAVIICASGISPAFNAVQLSDACENLQPAAFSQLWTELIARPFSFTAAKETKTPPCGEQKGRDLRWQSIIWKQRS